MEGHDILGISPGRYTTMLKELNSFLIANLMDYRHLMCVTADVLAYEAIAYGRKSVIDEFSHMLKSLEEEHERQLGAYKQET